MELTGDKEKKVTNSLDLKTEILKLANDEFFKIYT